MNNNWRDFVKLYENSWSYYSKKEEILKLVNNDIELAMIISYNFQYPKQWINTKIPALNYKTPKWCIENNKLEELKAILMRMPK